ncbi:MFS transporter [Tsukamurella tyrosinosolvens]|uniref:MFS transporter n=1 Tax=Tsukamurella tyrosinosolvens TaxID=57704 RepID=UPI00137503EA|nr:MFS transporter [Tsukamurella tyrosinosolvens]
MRQNRTANAVIGCCVTLVLVMSAVTGVNLALKGVSLELGATSGDLTWVADAYTVALAALVLPFGAIGDDFGRKRALIAGTIVFGVAAAIAGTADSVELVIAMRAVMGVGAAMAMPATLSTITTVLGADQRERGVALWSGFAAAGAVIGLVLSGALLEEFSWRSTFYGTAIFAAVTLVAVIILVPDTKSGETPSPDLLGALGVILGVGAGVYGLIEGSEKGWNDPHTLIAFAVAAVGIAVYGVVDARREHPMLDPRLFLIRRFTVGFVSLVAQFLGTFGFFFVSLQYIELVLDFGPLKTASAYLPLAAVVLLLSVIVPRVEKVTGATPLILLGFACMTVGFAFLAGLDAGSDNIDFLWPSIIFGGGLAFAGTPSTSVIVNALPPAKQGVASAVNDVTRELGAAIGIALLGSLFSARYSADAALPTSVEDAVRSAVEQSPAAGIAVASDPRLGPQGHEIAAHVTDAISSALQYSFTVGAVTVGVIGVVLAVLSASRPPIAAHRERP